MVQQHGSVSPAFAEKYPSAQNELSYKVISIRSGIDKVVTGQAGIPDSYRSAFKDHGQIFLLYDHDSLIDWTDNLFEAPVNLSYELLSHPFIDGSNGYFLLSSSKTEHYTIVGLQLVKFSYQYDNQYLPRNFYHKFRMPQEADISFDTGTNLYAERTEQDFLRFQWEQQHSRMVSLCPDICALCDQFPLPDFRAVRIISDHK
jgi:hypothetical protein